MSKKKKYQEKSKTLVAIAIMDITEGMAKVTMQVTLEDFHVEDSAMSVTMRYIEKDKYD